MISLKILISYSRLYFLRGHAQWFALVFSLSNFTLIFYNLLFVNLDFIPDFFKDYLVFFCLFMFFYFPISIIVGWYDYNRGTFQITNRKIGRIDPNWIKTHENQEEIIFLLNKLCKER